MAVNARGTMMFYKHAGKQMISQGRGGRIIGAFSISPLPLALTSIAGACSLRGKHGLIFTLRCATMTLTLREQAIALPLRIAQVSLLFAVLHRLPVRPLSN